MTRVPVWFLVCLLGIAVYHADAALYKCVDPSTKWIVYSDKPCEGDGGKLSLTENAVMDRTAAQDEISRGRAAAAQEQRERALSLQLGGGTGIRAPNAHDPQDDAPAGLTLTDGGALNMRGEFCVARDDGYLCPSGFVPK